MKKPIRNRSRRAVSAILGAVMLFAMIFTTGASYFLFVIASQQSLSSAQLNAQALRQATNLESFTPNSIQVATTLKIGVNITNLSPGMIKIVLIYVSNSSQVYQLDGTSGIGHATSPNLPQYINPGKFLVIDTQLSPTASITYTIKVVTDKGNVVVVTYPNAASAQFVAQSLITQGIGDIEMGFKNFKYALTGSIPLTWNQAANVTQNSYACFSVQLINHNVNDIYISQRSALVLMRVTGATGTFYIVQSVNNATGVPTALDGSTYVKVPANAANIAQGGTPVNVYFCAINVGGAGVSKTPSPGAAGDIFFVMMAFTGTYTATSSGNLFSELIPFKAVFLK